MINHSEIKNVVLCGLGAVGLTYADKLRNVCELFVLADEERIKKYKKQPPQLNNKELIFNYITPDDSLNADLIIISTKNDGLKSAIEYIKNFVSENTIIIALLNGISCEKEIAKIYGKDKVLHSYFIGHSAVRTANKVTQDGFGKIVFGSPYKENQKRVQKLKEFFSVSHIDFEIPDDIIYSMWLKFTMNVFSNQASAIMNLTFGDMKKNKSFKIFAKKVINEVSQIAKKEGIQHYEKLEADALKALQLMADNGKTSMLQDILAGRKTEVEIFSGEIIKLGNKYNLSTPCNKVMYDMIKILEEKGK